MAAGVCQVPACGTWASLLALIQPQGPPALRRLLGLGKPGHLPSPSALSLSSCSIRSGQSLCPPPCCQAGPQPEGPRHWPGVLVSRLLKGISSPLLRRTVPPYLQLSSAALPCICVSQPSTCPATLLQRGDPLLLSCPGLVGLVHPTGREAPRRSLTLLVLGSG